MYLALNQLFLFPLAPQSSADVSNVAEVDSTPLGKFLTRVINTAAALVAEKQYLWTLMLNQ